MLRYGYSLNTIQVTRDTGRGMHATLRVFIEYYSSDKKYGKRYARYVTGIQVTTRMMLVVGMLLRYSVRYSSPRFLCLLLAVNDADGYGKRKATVIL